MRNPSSTAECEIRFIAAPLRRLIICPVRWKVNGGWLVAPRYDVLIDHNRSVT